MRTFAKLILFVLTVSTFTISSQPISAQTNNTSSANASVGHLELLNTALDELSVELMQNLDPSGVYAIKSVSETSTGVPEDLLEQLTSSLQSSLMVASQFKINLIDQAQLPAAWANAVEFNGADFEELIRKTEFQAILILRSRATREGVELSLQAIGASAENSGSVLAGTKARLVQIDWEQAVGANALLEATEEIREIQAELERLQSLTSLISNPTTFTDYIHNARIHRRQNNTNGIIQNLEAAMKLNDQFLDVGNDLVQAVIKQYGSHNAQSYMENRIKPFVGEFVFEALTLKLDPSVNEKIERRLRLEKDIFSPLAAEWVKINESRITQQLRSELAGQWNTLNVFLKAVRVVVRDYESGKFQTYFLDNEKAYDLAQVEKMRSYDQEFNMAEVQQFTTDYVVGSGNTAYLYREIPRGMAGLRGDFDQVAVGFSSIEGDINLGESAITNGSLNGFFPGPCGVHFSEPVLPFAKMPQAAHWALKIYKDGKILKEFLQDGKLVQQEDYLQYMPMSSGRDRMVFADLCVKNQNTLKTYNAISEKRFGEKVFYKLRGLSELLITDEVDTNKPVLITYDIGNASEDVNTFTVDLTKDGTYFLPGGVSSHTTSGEGMDFFGGVATGFLYAPGILQGSIGAVSITQIRYTTIYGEEKVLIGDASYDGFDSSSNVRVLNIVEEQGYNSIKPTSVFSGPSGKFRNADLSQDRAWSMSRFGYDYYKHSQDDLASGSQAGQIATNDSQSSQDRTPLSLKYLEQCSFTRPVLHVYNVQNFVNLRKSTGFDARILEEVPLGGIVEAVDDIIYLYGTRENLALCKATCESAIRSPSVINKCVDENVLWFKVRSRSGKIGYISGKYLTAY